MTVDVRTRDILAVDITPPHHTDTHADRQTDGQHTGRKIDRQVANRQMVGSIDGPADWQAR